MSAVVLQLQNVEGSALATTFVDVDEGQLWMIIFREGVSRDENGQVELEFVRVPKTHHGGFDQLSECQL